MYVPRIIARHIGAVILKIQGAPRARPEPGFHGAVSQFKRHLIEVTLHQAGGNRTRAARELGLQRTYLLRLIRDLGVTAPPPPPPRRRALEAVH